MWKRNVIKHKNLNCRFMLEERLFILNPIFRETILGVRKETFDMMENIRIVNIESKSYSESETSFTIERYKRV